MGDRGIAALAVWLAVGTLPGCVEQPRLSASGFTEVGNFAASDGGDRVVRLSWTNPGGSFAETILRRGLAPLQTINDGELAYRGTDESFTDTGLDNSTTYHYAAFAVSTYGAASQGVGAVATTVAAGSLDPGFGNDGVTLHGPPGDQIPHAATLHDGSVIVAGETDGTGRDAAAWRFDVKGNRDPFFNFLGDAFGLDDAAFAVTGNGPHLLVGGVTDDGSSNEAAIWAISDVGGPDPTFGGGLVVLGATGDDDIADLEVTLDGLLAVGSTDVGSERHLALWRLTAQGALDPTFGPDGTGLVTHDPFGVASGDARGAAIAIDEGGRLVVAGSGFPERLGSDPELLVWRFDADGHADGTFHRFGVNAPTSRPGEGAAVVVQPVTGAVLAAGRARNGGADDMAVCAVSPVNGELLGEFGDAGSVHADATAGGLLFADGQDFATDMIVDDQGRLYVAGASVSDGSVADLDAVVWAFEADGRPRSGFGTSGAAVLDVAGTDDVAQTLLFDDTGRLVVVGTTVGPDGSQDLVLWRLFP